MNKRPDSEQPPASSTPPDWLHDAVRSSFAEACLFAGTLWGVTVKPMSFARAWAEGGHRAVNPLVFLAGCASLVAAVFQALPLIGSTFQDDPSFFALLRQTAGPFVQYAAAGLLAHLAMLLVRPRVRVLDSLGIALYAGGPALVGWVLSIAITAAVWRFLHLPDPHGSGFLSVMPDNARRWLGYADWVVIALFVRTLWLGLSGLHRGRWGVAGLATVFAMGVLAVVLGQLGLHGQFGTQLVLVHKADGWRFGYWD